MVNRSYAIITGVFILTMVVALVVVAMWLSGYRTAHVPYILVSRHSVIGLSPQATVYYRGIPVGSVVSVTFDQHPPHDVLVRIEVDPDVPITRDTYASLQSKGITGVVDIELGGSGKAEPLLSSSASAPARIPLHPSELDSLMASGKTLVSRLTRLTGNLNRFVGRANQAQVTRLLVSTRAAVRLLADDEKQLHTVLATLPGVSRQAQRTLTKIDDVASHLGDLSKSLNRFADIAGSAGQTLRLTTLPRLNGLLRQLRETSLQLQQLAAMIKHDPQSLLYGHARTPGPGEPGYRP